MRILFFINTLSSGGKERRLTELMKELSLKHNIYFDLAVMSDEIHYSEVCDLGVKIHFLIRKTRFDTRIIFKLYKLCKNTKPDIIHCWDSMTAMYSVPVCKLLNIRLFNGMVTNSPEKINILNKHWLRAKLTFPFSDVIVGNSNSGLLAYRAPERKSKVINNGFNFKRINNLTPKEIIREDLKITTEFTVGMVASFSENKDYRTFYTAAMNLLNKRKDVTFIAIGKGTDSEDSIGLIDKQFKNYFRLLGKKSGVESYINAMNICVLSTYTEGISNSILEYMALGKPVVATDGGGTNEIVENNKTGFLINQSDHVDLTRKLDLLLNDHELCKTMGLAGRRRVNERFAIGYMVEKYIGAYNSIL